PLLMMAIRGMDYVIHRRILDEETVDEIGAKFESNIPLSEKVKRALRCSVPRLKKCLLQRFPLIKWLPHYPIRETAIGDLISGINGGIMQIPLSIAYAMIAAVPPVFGLYAAFYPMLVYFIFGTSHHLIIGGYTVLALMMRGLGDRLAPDSDFMIWDNETNSSVVDTVSQDAKRVQVVVAVTLLSGLFQILLGLVQFGVMVTYLSEPLVRGYTTGATFHIFMSQFGNIFGVTYVRHNGPLMLPKNFIEFLFVLHVTHIPTLVVFVVAMVGLVVAKRVSEFLSKKLPVPVPVELLAVIISTLVSWKLNLNESYKIAVVGNIPSGLQPPSLPPTSLIGEVIGDAFAMAVVGYGMAISLGQVFALKHGYKVDSNQELIALGLSNAVGGLFQSIAISGSIPRSLVNESTGGKSQVLAGAVSAIVILIALFSIGSLLSDLPKAVLAAIIFVNVTGTLKQFHDIPALWKTSKVDMFIWLATFIFILLLNPDLGLPAAIGFSMLTVIFRTQRPKYSLLGQVQGTDIYRPFENYSQAVPGIVIFRSSATLYFANADMYKNALSKKSGLDVHKILATKKKQEAKRQKLQKENAKRTNGEGKEEGGSEHVGFIIFLIIIHSEPPVFSSFCVAFCVLFQIYRDYGKIGIEVLLAGCQTGVMDQLKIGGYFSDKVTKSCVFSTIHDAVLYCQPVRRTAEVILWNFVCTQFKK
uniref:Solute carrier family 26 member 6 n=1 Tax=Cynoglossus semilaevis TaxID=244447 RepID=A0A3P8V508_CYNSE